MENNLIKNVSPIFPIRTAAKLIGISIHTLRMYEREALIIPRKSIGNQRLYTFVDIERIVSIRKNMKELKLSINSIRMLLSMIPCYTIINCSKEDRKNCEAYHEVIKPCWDYEHKNNICADIDCRECEVYNSNFNFTKARETILKELQKEK